MLGSGTATGWDEGDAFGAGSNSFKVSRLTTAAKCAAGFFLWEPREVGECSLGVTCPAATPAGFHYI